MIVERIIERRPVPPIPEDFPADLHPVLARCYASRSVREAGELNLKLEQLPHYSLLKGVDEACRLLEEARQNDWRIIIVGDYDADGATSTAVAARGLRALGFDRVGFRVPDRFRHGYGLSRALVEDLCAESPELIITVDNGISSVAGVRAAQASGIRVLVTDHHLPGPELPAADAIVNPNQPGDCFPEKSLAGVGVVFYLLIAYRAFRRARDANTDLPNLAHLLDLVALGTVADLVPFTPVNRVLVEQGLRRLRAGHGNPGIRALMQEASRDPARATASDLGYAVGPRLNAAGRLDDMALGVRCLLEESWDAAIGQAAELNRLNSERRVIEAEMQEQAAVLVKAVETDSGQDPGICLYRPDWHEGVIGLVASRLKQRLHRPVLVMTDGEDGLVKGSARSIPGVHMRDILAAVDAAEPGLLRRFGGHAMAAGLSLSRDGLATFCLAWQRVLQSQVTDELLRARLATDGGLAPGELGLPLAEAVRFGGPWGQGFPEPLFDGRFTVLQHAVVGERHLKLVLCPEEGRERVSAIAFNAPLNSWLPLSSTVHLVYRLDINTFRGERSLQLVIEHLVLQ